MCIKIRRIQEHDTFLNSIQETYGHLPEYIVADGYGSESNYMAIIDNFNRTPLITYGMFKKIKLKI